MKHVDREYRVKAFIREAQTLRIFYSKGSLLLQTRTIRRSPTRLRGVLETLRGQPRLILPMLFHFVDRFTVGFFTTTFSLYVSRIHGFEPAETGLAIAAFMLPFALLSYPFGRLEF